MKTITARERDLILDVTGEGLTRLSPGILEKDLLITEVLRQASAFEHQGVQLVFCGGTCLSKAHGIIERMSEDVDFKVVITNPDHSSSSRRKLLSNFKNSLASYFRATELEVTEAGIAARNENSYITFNLQYQSQFPVVASLRPEIKLELNAWPPKRPTQLLPLRTLLHEALHDRPSPPTIQCLGIDETLQEKVLGFLRRTAEVMAKRHRGEIDHRLIRHVYDVHAITQARPDLVTGLSESEFQERIGDDARQFGNQFPEFIADPLGQMRQALAALQNESRFENDYRNFVDDLVYGNSVGFNEARSAFAAVAERLLAR